MSGLPKVSEDVFENPQEVDRADLSLELFTDFSLHCDFNRLTKLDSTAKRTAELEAVDRKSVV